MWFGDLPRWITFGTAGQIKEADQLRTDPFLCEDAATIADSEAGIASIERLDPRRQLLSSDSIFCFDKMAQFKLKVELENGVLGNHGYTGVPLIDLVSAGKAFFFCEVYEKDKVEPKIPQGSFEILKTVLVNVSDFYVCKLRSSGEAGVYVVDLYYFGPQSSEFVSESIVAFKVELLPSATGLTQPVWGIDLQNLCQLAWPFADPFRGGFLTKPTRVAGEEWQKFPHLIPKPEHRWIWSFPDPLDGYAGCDEAALFQRYLLGASIPIAPNDPADGGIPQVKK
jgi:hypothetical protein